MRWKRLLNLNARKTQPVPFDHSNNADAIELKMDGSVLGHIPGIVFLFLIGLGRLALSLLLKLRLNKLEL